MLISLNFVLLFYVAVLILLLFISYHILAVSPARYQIQLPDSDTGNRFRCKILLDFTATSLFV